MQVMDSDDFIEREAEESGEELCSDASEEEKTEGNDEGEFPVACHDRHIFYHCHSL